jgi:16S rRNA (guanine527-N7)-methyltransferase
VTAPAGLREAAAVLGVALTQASEARLGRLLARVREEGESQNLTAILEPGDMVVDHLIDSLALAEVASSLGVPPGDGTRCVDIGSGAGFPGIPLAAAFPGTRWTLVESEGRKAAWLRGIVAELGLKGVEVFHGRARELRHNRPDLEGACDLVTARAVGDLGKLAREARGLLRPGGLLLCPKGPSLDDAERALGAREAKKSRLEPAGEIPMKVPGRQRACVVYRAIAPPPATPPGSAGRS